MEPTYTQRYDAINMGEYGYGAEMMPEEVNPATMNNAAAAAATADTGTDNDGSLPIDIAYDRSSESVVLFVRRGREVWGKVTFELIAKHSQAKYKHSQIQINMRNCIIKKLLVQGTEYEKSNYCVYRFIDNPLPTPQENGSFCMYNIASSLGSGDHCNTLKFSAWNSEGDETKFEVELWYRLENTPEDLLVGLKETSIIRPGASADAPSSSIYRHWYSDGTLDQACFWMPHIKYVPITSLKIIARRELVVFGPGVLKEITDKSVSSDTVASAINEVVGKGKVHRKEAIKYAIHNFILRRYVDHNSIGIAIGPFRIKQGADGRNLSSCVVNGCLPGREGPELRDTVGNIAERALAFFNEVFPGFEYPWPWYHQVFVHDTGYITSQNGSAFAGLAVLPEELLHTSDVELDVCFRKAEIIAECVAAQWFGVCITPEEMRDYWIAVGLRKWLARRFLRLVFGTDYARMQDFKEGDELMDKCWGRSLEARAPDEWVHWNERQTRRYELKAYFAVMTFASIIGADEFQGWIGKFALDCQKLSKHGRGCPSAIFSTNEFFNFFINAQLVSADQVTRFYNMWVIGSGFPPLRAGISVNHISTHKNFDFYSIPDTKFPRECSEWDIRIKFKGQKNTRLSSGKEQSHFEFKWPRSFGLEGTSIRLDPNFTFPHKVRFPVPAAMLNYARPENKPDIRGVYEAIDILSYKHVLEKDESKRLQQSREALSILESIAFNRDVYWEIRAAAMRSMVSIVYSDQTSNGGATSIIEWYNKTYSEATLPVLVGTDTGYSIHDYLIQRELITAISEAQTTDRHSPKNVINFILGLFKRVDTTPLNPISNRYIVARLCRALGTLDYNEDGNLILEACIWLNRWIKIDLRSPGHGSVVFVEASRSLLLISLQPTNIEEDKSNYINGSSEKLWGLFGQLLSNNSSPALGCEVLKSCFILVEQLFKKQNLQNFITYIYTGIDWLISSLTNPCSRIRMCGADLLRELTVFVSPRKKSAYDAVTYDPNSQNAIILRNHIISKEINFFSMIKDTRDNLFRSVLIDIFSFVRGYTSEIFLSELGESQK